MPGNGFLVEELCFSSREREKTDFFKNFFSWSVNTGKGYTGAFIFTAKKKEFSGPKKNLFF
jgi:hypothetical protein